MKKHSKKMIAPLIVTICMVLYYLGLAVAVIVDNPPIIVCILAVLIPGLLGGVMIAMCIQRMNEIRSGEEDDLGQY